MTQDEALTAFATCIATLSGLSAPVDQPLVYRGKRDRPRPDVGTFRITPLSDVGDARPYRVNATTLEQHRQVEVQVDAIGATVQAAALRVHALLQGDTPGRRTLTAAGVAVQRVTAALNASELLQTSQEPRTLWTVTLGYVASFDNSGRGTEATAIELSMQGEPAVGDELDAEDVATVAIP